MSKNCPLKERLVSFLTMRKAVFMGNLLRKKGLCLRKPNYAWCINIQRTLVNDLRIKDYLSGLSVIWNLNHYCILPLHFWSFAFYVHLAESLTLKLRLPLFLSRFSQYETVPTSTVLCISLQAVLGDWPKGTKLIRKMKCKLSYLNLCFHVSLIIDISIILSLAISNSLPEFALVQWT